MSTSGLAALTAIAALALGANAALAQPGPAPPTSPLHEQAQLNHDAHACTQAVEKAADNIWLRIQSGKGMNDRMLTNSLLQAGRNAAASSDEDMCWHWYDRAQNQSR